MVTLLMTLSDLKGHCKHYSRFEVSISKIQHYRLYKTAHSFDPARVSTNIKQYY